MCTCRSADASDVPSLQSADTSLHASNSSSGSRHYETASEEPSTGPHSERVSAAEEEDHVIKTKVASKRKAAHKSKNAASKTKKLKKEDVKTEMDEATATQPPAAAKTKPKLVKTGVKQEAANCVDAVERHDSADDAKTNNNEKPNDTSVAATSDHVGKKKPAGGAGAAAATAPGMSMTSSPTDTEVPPTLETNTPVSTGSSAETSHVNTPSTCMSETEDAKQTAHAPKTPRVPVAARVNDEGCAGGAPIAAKYVGSHVSSHGEYSVLYRTCEIS